MLLFGILIAMYNSEILIMKPFAKEKILKNIKMKNRRRTYNEKI